VTPAECGARSYLAVAGEELGQPFVALPEIGGLAAPVAEQEFDVCFSCVSSLSRDLHRTRRLVKPT
jgi:hypothetical protein